MEFHDTALPEVKIAVPRRIGDARGFFSEVWNARDFFFGWDLRRFRPGQSCPQPRAGYVARLAFSNAPVAQGKLVRVTRGAIFDVAVDIRRGSSTFGRYADAVLSAENWHQLWVPAGFAHGYCTLDDDPEVQY